MFSLSMTQILYSIPAFIIAISCHEFAHAWVADRFGDPTARQYGRLTLNPISHIDLFGLVLFFVAGFGWAKGVPYNAAYFRGNKRIAMIAVSLAGVTANLILAVLSLSLYAILLYNMSYSQTHFVILQVLQMMFSYNVMFFVLNLMPIPPLDGSKLVAALLPGDFEAKIAAVNPYGFFILIGLIYLAGFSKVLGVLTDKMAQGLVQVIFPIFQGGF